jgi:Protein of unknown function (DUF4199)
MRKVTLIFGLLSGAIISMFMVIGFALFETGVMTTYFSELVGYGTMVIALSMIFFGIKSYRDNYQKGAIGFWKGIQVGLLISLIASLMYALTWETYMQARPKSADSFLEKYTNSVINKMKEKGASAEKIEQEIRKMDNMMKMYRNPVFRFGITILEILPVGIIITLISAALLRKKELLPAHHLERNNPRLET